MFVYCLPLFVFVRLLLSLFVFCLFRCLFYFVRSRLGLGLGLGLGLSFLLSFVLAVYWFFTVYVGVWSKRLATSGQEGKGWGQLASNKMGGWVRSWH